MTRAQPANTPRQFAPFYWFLPRLGQCLLAALVSGFAPVARAQTDSLTLPYQVYYEQVMQNHPIVRLANTLPEQARMQLREARGAFDPKVGVDWARYEFKGTEYYNMRDYGIKIPTWAGIDLKGGFQQNTGTYLNPADQTNNGRGYTYLGLSVPLGQGLVIDSRRATLRQAQIAQNLAQADRLKEINKAILNAAKTYWDWYFAYHQFLLLREGYQLADTRFRATKRRAELGDAAGIDTVEAKITLQDRSVQLEQARVEFQNAGILVSNFLWDEAENPLELPPTAVPEAVNLAVVITEQTRQALVDTARARHPEIASLTFKIQQLQVEQRYRRDLLKPQVYFDLTALDARTFLNTETNGGNSGNFFMNNNKIGLSASIPLFLRKERGKLQQVGIKINQTDFDRMQTGRDIINTINTGYNDVKNLEKQIAVQQDAVVNQGRLLRGENQKFELGESSLFLINTRENKLIDMRIKLEEMKSKYEKAKAQLAYAAGATRL